MYDIFTIVSSNNILSSEHMLQLVIFQLDSMTIKKNYKNPILIIYIFKF